jgi:hypothetical protein
MVSHHPFDIQRLNSDQLVFLNQLGCNFVEVVATDV